MAPAVTIRGGLSDRAIRALAKLCLRVADRKREKAEAERKKVRS